MGLLLVGGCVHLFWFIFAFPLAVCTLRKLLQRVSFLRGEVSLGVCQGNVDKKKQ